MISFDTPSHRFHLRAVAIIRRQTSVLLHRLRTDAYWTLPGGRVEPGETAAQTVQRELEEELGISATIGPCTLVAEHFFSYEDRAYHELGLYFEVDLPAGALPFGVPILGMEQDKTLVFQWFDRDDLDQIDVRPSALRETLKHGSAARDAVAGQGLTRHAVFNETPETAQPAQKR